jgi:chromosome segregation ATPase
MTPENQALLAAIREMIIEANAPIVARLEGLERRIGQLEERIGQLEGRIGQLEGRMDRLEGRMDRLERHVETIDTRTSQILSDFQDLRDRVPLLEERIDNGFRALKSDLTFAFSDIRKIAAAQDRGDKVIEGLRREIAGLQQRLAALEGRQSTS